MPKGDRNSFFLLFIGIVALGLMGLNWRFGDQSGQSQALSETNHQLTIMLQEKDYEIRRLQDRLLLQERELALSTSSIKKSMKEEILLKKLDEYTMYHKQVMEGTLPPKFVKCVLINGWGNVFQEAISCFLFAFASNRAAIFDTGAIDGYMPFKKYMEMRNFDGYNKQIMQAHVPVVVPRFDLACLDYTQMNASVIEVHLTYDWYAPNVLVNPYHGEKIWEILPINYYDIMFNYVFKFEESVQKAVDDYKRNHFGEFTIGIQVRAPTYTKKGEKDHKGFPVPPIDLYAQIAEQVTRFQNQVPYERVKWFLATQNLEILNYLQASYGDKIIFYDAPITTTFENDPEGQKTSLVTWAILAQANEVITTEASSYGTTAAASTGKYPIVCNHDKYCMRRMSPTPCQDTHWLKDQPAECLTKIRKHPHQFLSSPEASCGHYKLAIYTSDEYQKAKKEPGIS